MTMTRHIRGRIEDARQFIANLNADREEDAHDTIDKAFDKLRDISFSPQKRAQLEGATSEKELAEVLGSLFFGFDKLVKNLELLKGVHGKSIDGFVGRLQELKEALLAQSPEEDDATEADAAAARDDQSSYTQAPSASEDMVRKYAKPAQAPKKPPTPPTPRKTESPSSPSAGQTALTDQIERERRRSEKTV